MVDKVPALDGRTRSVGRATHAIWAAARPLNLVVTQLKRQVP
jgi:hypothetical protein